MRTTNIYLTWNGQTNWIGFDITSGLRIANGSYAPLALVDACSDLAHPAWQTVLGTPLMNGTNHFSEPVQNNASARFYRVRLWLN